MKKLILLFSILFITGMVIDLRADDYDNDYSNNYDKLNLSTSQRAKIKDLRREASYKFQEIGRSSMYGQEKGLQKREVAIELRKSIWDVLDSSQQAEYEKRYRDNSSYSYTRDEIKDKYEDKLDRLEDQYDRNVDRVESDRRLSKSERKYKIKELKYEYNSQKEAIKRERDQALFKD